MDINEITIGQAREIAQVIASLRVAAPNVANIGLAKEVGGSRSIGGLIGKQVIVRTYSAGVHFGTLSEKDGNEVILTDARRLWCWKAEESISLSAVAVHGIDAKKSKIAPPVPSIWLEAIEIIPASAEAISSIIEAPHAEAA